MCGVFLAGQGNGKCCNKMSGIINGVIMKFNCRGLTLCSCRWKLNMPKAKLINSYNNMICLLPKVFIGIRIHRNLSLSPRGDSD